MLVTGAVTVWAAASFLSLYAAYVLLVWTTHCCFAAAGGTGDSSSKPSKSGDLAAPLLPVASSKPTAAALPRTLAHRLLAALHFSLYLPRRLTILDIAVHRWSKPYAVASMLFSPSTVLPWQRKSELRFHPSSRCALAGSPSAEP